MNDIKAIFFDLGNVIVRFDFNILEKGLSPYGYKPTENMWDFIVYDKLPVKYMRGKITSSKFYEFVSRRFKIKASYREFYEVWNSIFYPYPEVEEIINNLKEKYPKIPLILVSDTNEEHFGYVKNNYKILNKLDHYVLSHEVGAVKPNSKMYTSALKLAGVPARNVFYTDDRDDLIKSARSMGLRAFQFTGHTGLREQLLNCGMEV
ncbi:HAD-superfamily hydrolase [Candidatus Omnitrophus magneticus]|uniref:HAD-superfamily hydrolase n=1 Tax=Candidatus Omnitrophus magneticus TaxID=1609969 RepID=A0A0F0CPY3_9BACT|nr:HAD-superfamily hydrolase [Candidatus Omnitrophus magneticus]